MSTAAGHIVVYDLTTHRSTSLITETTQRISAIAFNPYRPKLLAAACEDGSVRLFDVAASLLPLHTFEAAHSASCTGLAFSTQYKMVMASVGLDDCIVLYDVEKKTCAVCSMKHSLIALTLVGCCGRSLPMCRWCP